MIIEHCDERAPPQFCLFLCMCARGFSVWRFLLFGNNRQAAISAAIAFRSLISTSAAAIVAIWRNDAASETNGDSKRRTSRGERRCGESIGSSVAVESRRDIFPLNNCDLQRADRLAFAALRSAADGSDHLVGSAARRFAPCAIFAGRRRSRSRRLARQLHLDHVALDDGAGARPTRELGKVAAPAW